LNNKESLFYRFVFLVSNMLMTKKKKRLKRK